MKLEDLHALELRMLKQEQECGIPSPTPESSETALDLLHQLAAQLGIPRVAWNASPAEVRPIWNGKTLMVPPNVDDVCHEIAHWLLATPERRNWPNYGLGPDYLTGTRVAQLSTVDAVLQAHEEEARASALGILMVRHLGLDWKYWYRDHDWDVHHSEAFVNTCEELGELGLIDLWTPVCLKNLEPS